MSIKKKFKKFIIPGMLIGTMLLSACSATSGGTELKKLVPVLKKETSFTKYSATTDGSASIRTLKDKYNLTYTGNSISDVSNMENIKSDSELNLKLKGEPFNKTNKDEESKPVFTDELKKEFLKETDTKLEFKVRGTEVEMRIKPIKDLITKKIDVTAARLGEEYKEDADQLKFGLNMMFGMILGKDGDVVVINPEEMNTTPAKSSLQTNEELKNLTLDFIENKIGDYKSPSLSVSKDGYEIKLDKTNLAKEVLSISKYIDNNKDRLTKDITEYINKVNEIQGTNEKVTEEDIKEIFDSIQDKSKETNEKSSKNPIETIKEVKTALDTFKEFNLNVKVDIKNKEINKTSNFKIFVKEPEKVDSKNELYEAIKGIGELDIDLQNNTVIKKEDKDLKFNEFTGKKVNLTDMLKAMEGDSEEFIDDTYEPEQ